MSFLLQSDPRLRTCNIMTEKTRQNVELQALKNAVINLQQRVTHLETEVKTLTRMRR